MNKSLPQTEKVSKATDIKIEGQNARDILTDPDTLTYVCAFCLTHLENMNRITCSGTTDIYANIT